VVARFAFEDVSFVLGRRAHRRSPNAQMHIGAPLVHTQWLRTTKTVHVVGATVGSSAIVSIVGTTVAGVVKRASFAILIFASIPDSLA